MALDLSAFVRTRLFSMILFLIDLIFSQHDLSWLEFLYFFRILTILDLDSSVFSWFFKHCSVSAIRVSTCVKVFMFGEYLIPLLKRLNSELEKTVSE